MAVGFFVGCFVGRIEGFFDGRAVGLTGRNMYTFKKTANVFKETAFLETSRRLLGFYKSRLLN